MRGANPEPNVVGMSSHYLHFNILLIHQHVLGNMAAVFSILENNISIETLPQFLREYIHGQTRSGPKSYIVNVHLHFL